MEGWQGERAREMKSAQGLDQSTVFCLPLCYQLYKMKMSEILQQAITARQRAAHRLTAVSSGSYRPKTRGHLSPRALRFLLPCQEAELSLCLSVTLEKWCAVGRGRVQQRCCTDPIENSCSPTVCSTPLGVPHEHPPPPHTAACGIYFSSLCSMH